MPANPTVVRVLYEEWRSLTRKSTLADAKARAEKAERDLAVAAAFYDWAVAEGEK